LIDFFYVDEIEKIIKDYESKHMKEISKRQLEIDHNKKIIEDKILIGLTKNSKIADILEDDELIKILEESKKTSDEINVRMKESEVTEKEIDKTREIYRPVAYRASILFFTIIDLAIIDPMYQYSLKFFCMIYERALDRAEGKVDKNERNKRKESL
jgi:dynein heavy chain